MTPGLRGSRKGGREIPARVQEIKARSSSAPPEELGIQQAYCAHVLTPSAWPTWLKIREYGTSCLRACTTAPCVYACSHTWPTRGSGCLTEPHTHLMSVCATVGSPAHPSARACSCTHLCMVVCTVGVCNWVCKHGGAHSRVVVRVCSVHACACTRKSVSGRRSMWVGSVRVGWCVLCPGTTRWCPASMSPFGDPNVHPVKGHGGDVALCGVMTLPGAGPQVLGLSSQAEPLTTAKGQ